ncbi:hypothetical protein JTE90_024449 [Oedothorax gibbosus]|uniref:Major facilitator superfamily (MFS) profile domain-containing protein n=1 Tax=Oedothorax gibbosus TaxID=931172 RepID=A0AAV6UBP6_9ARAC|nr:hypothetical protein JTE90_024449 [Oedothorax gibbosus]
MVESELNIEEAGDNSSVVVPVENLRNTHLATVSALLFIVVMGMVTSYSAPATVDMRAEGSRLRDITSDEITWIASLPLFSGIIGNTVSGYATHKLGRKAVLMLVSVTYVLSWLVIAYAPTVSVVYIGRLLSGFCQGMCSVTIPAYIVEIAPPAIRGLLSSGFQVAFSFGVLVVMSLGTVLRWSWLAVAGAVIVTLGSFLMLFMPESPPWLIRESRTAEAMRGLRFLKGPKADTKKAFSDISASLAFQEVGKFTIRQLRESSFYKPVSIAVSLMFFQQFSGINPLMSYTVDIFQDTGTSIQPKYASIVVAVVQVAGTVITSFLMDRTGRRLLFTTSSFFMSVGLMSLGVYQYMASKNQVDIDSYGWIPLASFVVYIFAFSLGVGPIPFVMTPEISPLRSRSLIMAIASLFNSLFGFGVTKVFNDMRNLIGLYGLYWTYCFFSFASALFGFFLLPETKGMSLHEIQRSLSVSRS